MSHLSICSISNVIFKKIDLCDNPEFPLWAYDAQSDMDILELLKNGQWHSRVHGAVWGIRITKNRFKKKTWILRLGIVGGAKLEEVLTFKTKKEAIQHINLYFETI